MGIKLIHPLEKNIEQSFRRWCKQRNILAIKLYSPSYPDRLVLGPGATFVFIEFKRPGGKLTLNQKAVHLSLKALGFPVYVCRSKKEAVEAYNEECEKQRG